MSQLLEKNILVISDLHLGEDLKPGATGVSYLRRLATLEKELCAFLDHYTAHRRDERPWRLVVNGDMVDFMSIQLMPEGSDGSDEERQYGLAHDEHCSLAKLSRVVERHTAVFDALARFCAAGNELVVIVGNHDVEFHFGGVQRRMIEALELRGAPSGAIRFCPWFYFEEEVVYIEHGHQYDEYCSFDYMLHPVEAKGGVTLSLAHAGMRYFANLVPQLNPHTCEAWGFMDYMRWAHTQGARRVARVVLLYAHLIRKLFELWSLFTNRAADVERARLHGDRLKEMAGQYRMTVEKVQALDGLRRLPVLKSAGKILSALFLDRMLLGVAVAGMVGFASVALPGWWKLVGVCGALVVGAAANQVLARLRELDSAKLLRRAPEAIWKIVRAPFIVFGHSHRPERIELASGGTYFNTGTWAPPTEEEQLAGAPPTAFTHLLIANGDGAPHAELCQWRDGGSTRWTA